MCKWMACILIKFYLQTLKIWISCSFHMSRDIRTLIYFNHFKNSKPIYGFWAIAKQAWGQVWPKVPWDQSWNLGTVTSAPYILLMPEHEYVISRSCIKPLAAFDMVMSSLKSPGKAGLLARCVWDLQNK